MKSEIKDFDVAEFLNDDDDIQAYLNAAIDENDPKYLFIALGHIARAKNISQLSKQTGMSREGIYKALSGEGNPAFGTVLKIIHALDMDIQVIASKKQKITC